MINKYYILCITAGGHKSHVPHVLDSEGISRLWDRSIYLENHLFNQQHLLPHPQRTNLCALLLGPYVLGRPWEKSFPITCNMMVSETQIFGR